MKVVALRKARKPPMKQEELAGRLRELGFNFDQTSLSRLERGERPISVNLLCALAIALDAPLAALLAPLDDDDSTVEVGEGLEVTSGTMGMWVQGMGPLPGMDEEQFNKIAATLTIPREAIERGGEPF